LCLNADCLGRIHYSHQPGFSTLIEAYKQVFSSIKPQYGSVKIVRREERSNFRVYFSWVFPVGISDPKRIASNPVDSSRNLIPIS
jgi:hypothetical protein